MGRDWGTTGSSFLLCKKGTGNDGAQVNSYSNETYSDSDPG